MRLKHIAGRLSQGLAEANQHVHRLSHGILPVQIDAEGLRASLEQLAAATDTQRNVTCRFQCSGPVAVPDNNSATHLYRIAQEALNNALRHSRADEICISLSQADDQVVVEVSDNGIGFDPMTGSRRRSVGGGMGLRTMEYRAGLMSGVLHIQRELEIFGMIGAGQTTGAIADQLHLIWLLSRTPTRLSTQYAGTPPSDWRPSDRWPVAWPTNCGTR